MGPLSMSYSNEYMLLEVEYVSKCVEAATVKTVYFLRFGSPRVLINDGGTHFCNRLIKKVFEHYKIRHKVITPYHPLMNGQAKVSNKDLKIIFEKTTANSKKD